MHLWHRDGRVTKAEGIREHPVNHGGLCARGQSSLQGLYDPDRLTRVRWMGPARELAQSVGATGGRPPFAPENDGASAGRPYNAAVADVAAFVSRGQGRVWILSDLQTGALKEVMHAFHSQFFANVFFYEPFNYEPLADAQHAVFGLRSIPDYRLDECGFVISFAADFLETWVSPVAFAHRFSIMHSVREGSVGRFVYVGPRMSSTAANADDFLLVPPGAERDLALAMLKTIVDRGWARVGAGELKSVIDAIPATVPIVPGVSADRIAGLAKAFVDAKGSVALAGPAGTSSPVAWETGVAAALLNYAAGRVGTTVDFSRPHALGDLGWGVDPVVVQGSHTITWDYVRGEFRNLFSMLGKDDIVILHNVNPAFTKPGGADLLAKAGMRVYLGTMLDETARRCDWVIPVDHPLETWGDYEPVAGVHSFMQPTMGRMSDTRPAGDFFLDVARAAGKPLSRPDSATTPVDFQAWLFERMDEIGARVAPGKPAADFRRDALRAGFVVEEPEPVTVKLRDDVAKLRFSELPLAGPSELSLWVYPSIMLFDGRSANRGWLQEAPDPMSTIVWGSWVDVHPARAKELGICEGDVLELSTDSGKIEAPTHLTDDVGENVVAIATGQGHTGMGRFCDGRGANPFKLLPMDWDASRVFPEVTLRKTGANAEPVGTATTRDQHERELMNWIALSELRTLKPGEGEKIVLPMKEGYQPKTDVWRGHKYKANRWVMVVDLQRCIGCGACAVACSAENNIPFMGEDASRRYLFMHWLRIIPYREPHGSRVGFLPVLCQHCDAAPCEPVCPVYAAVHNEEGLNSQVYNRCVGTRYCSNNCPYKVRRFNWLNVPWDERKPLDWQLNPDVTVRVRGVMEKCTFCIQRIREAQYRARKENRKVRDGEIQPACVQSCPAHVYTFGNLLDPESEAAKLFVLDPRHYQVLAPLNTKPGVVYLKRVRRDETA
jgi:molybdopterin-containing oxidoreductase family iron-sulfur binding subunit